jgi:hypothetical protein
MATNPISLLDRLKQLQATTPPADASPQVEPAAEPTTTTLSLRDRLLQAQQAPVPTPQPAPAKPVVSKPAPTTTSYADPVTNQPYWNPNQPGFLKGAWSTLNPVPAIKGFGTALGQHAAETEAIRTDTRLPHWKRMLKAGKEDLTFPFQLLGGMVTGTVQGLHDAANDVYEGRVRTGVGKATGIVGPMILGAAAKKYMPAKKVPVVPKTLQTLEKAEGELNKVRATLPTTAPGTFQEGVKTAAGERLSEYGKVVKDTKLAETEVVTKDYARYQEALDKAIEPPGFVKKHGIPDKKKGTWKVPPVIAEGPTKAPMALAKVREGLKAIVSSDTYLALEESNPIRKVLDDLMKKDKKGNYVGNDYIEHDVFRKKISRLNRANLDAPSSRLMGEIKEAVDPLLVDHLQEIITKRGIKQGEAVFKSVESGAKASYQKNLIHSKMTEARKLEKSGYAEAAARFPQPPKPIAARRTYGLASTSASERELVNHLTQGKGAGERLRNLSAVTKVDYGPELLGKVVDDVQGSRDWSRWNKIEPDVINQLTAHQPDLANSLGEIFKQLTEAEALHGEAATTTALQKAVASLEGVTKGKVGFILPGKVHKWSHNLSYLLTKQESARKVNQALRTQISRIPLTVRAARGIATLGQATAASTPLSKVAEATAPPADNTKMAGE